MEVSCRAFAYFQQAELKGFVQLDELLEGSTLDRATLERPTARVAWEDWRLLCERYAELVGGVEVVEKQSVELLVESQLGGAIGAMATFIAGPADYIRLVLNRVAPSLFRFVEWEVLTLPDGRIQATLTIPPEHSGSQAWMSMARGGIPAIPLFLGVPAAVSSGHLGPRGGTLVLTPPPDRSFFSLLRRWIFFWRAASVVSAELEFHQRALLETERSLMESEATLRAMVEAFPDLLVLVDADLRVRQYQVGHEVEAPPVPAGLLGEPLPEVLARLGLEDDPSAKAALQRVRRALEVQQPDSFEFRQPREGAELVFDIRLRLFRRDRLLILARDLSRQRYLERQVTVAERLTSVGQLAAGVAHEINNPLTVLATNLPELRYQLGLHVTPEVTELLSESLGSVERVRRIVRDLSRFTRADPLDLYDVDIPAVLQDAANMARHDLRHRVGLEMDIAEHLPLVHADAGRLVQVLVNLLMNAAQATEGHAGGTVTLSARHDSQSGEVILSVADDGPGISREVLPRMFDPFFTTKAPGEGTGLGLSISRTAVTSMGGTLTAYNRPSGGACLELRLPVQPVSAPTPAPAPPRERVQGRHVMVIDDEPAVGRAVGRLLRGNEVTLATSTKHARELLQGEQLPDVILCDLMMPGVTGSAWLQSLALSDPIRARIIFMTGGAVTTEAQRFLARPDTRYLLKPFTPDELHRAVARRLQAEPAR